MTAYQRRLSSKTKEKIGILEPNDFFQNQVKQCVFQAESAVNKNDRKFWLQLAHRWERLQASGVAIEKANEMIAPNKNPGTRSPGPLRSDVDSHSFSNRALGS
jgi:hypothetical protein